MWFCSYNFPGSYLEQAHSRLKKKTPISLPTKLPAFEKFIVKLEQQHTEKTPCHQPSSLKHTLTPLSNNKS
jgi:hypothetical protein